MSINDVKALYRKIVPEIVRRFVRQAIQPRKTLFSLYVYTLGSSVMSGPFTGMKFERKCGDISKLLGTYELELHDVFSKLKNRNYSRIIDIGAAEGYYAVGVTRWNSNCSVIAFEANPELHKKISYLAKINNATSKIQIRGFCDVEQLNDMGDNLNGAFLIVDIEGYEKELLDPRIIPLLQKSTILVETHDHEVPGCYDTIIERFQNTHEISVYKSRPRVIDEYPLHLSSLSLLLMSDVIIDSISDHRAVSNYWLLLEPSR